MTQADPKPNASRPIWPLVIEDMKKRDLTGRAKYGVPLQAGNGRKQLQDAYEEVLDLAVYLRAEIEERGRAQIRTWREAAQVMREKAADEFTVAPMPIFYRRIAEEFEAKATAMEAKMESR